MLLKERTEAAVIFFDIDNTLIDYNASEKAAFTELMLRECGISVSEEQYGYWHSISKSWFQRFLDKELTYEEQGMKRISAFAGYCGIEMNTGKASQLFEEYQDILSGHWKLFEDVKPALDRLSGKRLGIISNGKSTQQRQKLVDTGIDDKFDVRVFSEDAGFAKPSAGIFRYAAEAAGESTADMIYVGDNYSTDIEPCIALGIRCFLISRESTLSERVNRICTLNELADILSD